MKSSTLGFLALVLAAFLFATFGVYIRVLSLDLNSYQQIFFRGLLGFLLAGSLLSVLRKKIELRGVSKKTLAAYTLTFPFVVILFTFSILATKLTATLFGFYAGTLITSLLLGIQFFNESVTLTKKVALGLALGGLVIYTYPLSTNSFNVGLVLAFLSGLLDAVANALRKHLTNKIDRLVLVALQVLGMAVVSLPFVIFTLSDGLPTISPISWLVGLWFGVMLIVVNYLLLFGFSHFDLNLGSIALSSELFFAGIIGFLIYGEGVKPLELLGAVIMVLAMATTSLNLEKIVRKLGLA